MPDNDMGDPKNITNKTFKEAAEAAGQSVEEAKRNTLALLEDRWVGPSQRSQAVARRALPSRSRRGLAYSHAVLFGVR
jgi:hypothetical protein